MIVKKREAAAGIYSLEIATSVQGVKQKRCVSRLYVSKPSKAEANNDDPEESRSGRGKGVMKEWPNMRIISGCDAVLNLFQPELTGGIIATSSPSWITSPWAPLPASSSRST